MPAQPKVLAIIPARAGSKGLPDKNIKLLGGQPLLTWPIRAALACRSISKVVLSTDSDEYAVIGEQAGAIVPGLRPAHLAADTASSIDVVEHVLSGLNEQFDFVVLLEPTSPLTSEDILDEAIAALVASDSSEACVAVVKEIDAHPRFLFTKGSNHNLQPFLQENLGKGVRRQDVSEVFRPEGSFYLSKVETLLQKKSFYHSATLGWEVPDWMSFEIDTPLDFIIVEAIARHKGLID